MQAFAPRSCSSGAPLGYAMRRSYYAIIIFASIVLALIAEVSIVWSHGDNPFADMSHLILGSIVWLVLIMIALLLIFFMLKRMSD